MHHRGKGLKLLLSVPIRISLLSTAVLSTHPFARSSWSVTTWCSAESISPAVPRTKAAFLLCVGAAVDDTALALCAMLIAHTSCFCFVGAAINRTWFHTATAVLGAHTFTRNSRRDTTWCSAEPISPAVPPTKAIFILCVGAAVADHALAFCAVFTAQASSVCVGAAAINGAWGSTAVLVTHTFAIHSRSATP